MKKEKKIFIVVPVHNRKNITLHFLNQLYNQYYKDFKIIIIDDGSDDETFNAIKKIFPNVIIIKGDGKWWWTKSVNEGCKYAIKNGAYAVILMNDDTNFDQDYLGNILRFLDKDSIIGSLCLTISKPHQFFFSGIRKFSLYTGKDKMYYKKFTSYKNDLAGIKISYGLPGRGLLIPKSIFDRVGYFDENRLPQYKADYDFVLRANKLGIKSYICYDAIIYSHTEMTGKGSVFIDQSLGDFIKSYFSKYTHNSLSSCFYYVLKHTKWFAFIFAFSFQIISSFILFIYKYYSNKFRYNSKQ